MKQLVSSSETKQLLEAVDHLGNICGALQECTDEVIGENMLEPKAIEIYKQLLTHARSELANVLADLSCPQPEARMQSMSQQIECIQGYLHAVVGATPDKAQDALDESSAACRLGKTMTKIWQEWILRDANDLRQIT